MLSQVTDAQVSRRPVKPSLGFADLFFLFEETRERFLHHIHGFLPVVQGLVRVDHERSF